MDRIKIGGLMQSDSRAMIKVMAVPYSPPAAGAMFSALGSRGINLELLVQNYDTENQANFAMVVAEENLDHALSILQNMKASLGAREVSATPDVAILSIFGPHLREKPHVPGLMFTALAEAGLAPLAISTSISTVSAVVPGADLETAVDALLDVFDIPFQVKKRPKDY